MVPVIPDANRGPGARSRADQYARAGGAGSSWRHRPACESQGWRNVTARVDSRTDHCAEHRPVTA